MIKNIILDIGNVLVDFRYHDYMTELGFSEEVMKAMEERVILNDLWDQLDLGIRDEEEIINEMFTRVPEYEKECRVFFDNIINIVKTYDYAESWVKQLKTKGYKVYLLSNYPRSLFTLHEKSSFSFAKYVDGKVVSAFIKMSKPDARIYNYLLEQYTLKPEECLFFDDRQINIDAAVKCGFNAHLFTTYEDAVNTIDKLENLNK